LLKLFFLFYAKLRYGVFHWDLMFKWFKYDVFFFFLFVISLSPFFPNSSICMLMCTHVLFLFMV
jgi:hypothetical protein